MQLFSKESQYCSSGQDPIASPSHRPCGAESREHKACCKLMGAKWPLTQIPRNILCVSVGKGTQTKLAPNSSCIHWCRLTFPCFSFPTYEVVIPRVPPSSHQLHPAWPCSPPSFHAVLLSATGPLHMLFPLHKMFFFPHNPFVGYFLLKISEPFFFREAFLTLPHTVTSHLYTLAMPFACHCGCFPFTLSLTPTVGIMWKGGPGPSC